METIKEYLYAIKHERREIDELRDQIDRLRSDLLPKGIVYDGDRVQSSPRDSMSEAVARLVDFEDQLGRRLTRLLERQLYAESLVAQLTDSTERQIIDLFFLSSSTLRMEAVADVVGYSMQQCWRIYSRALANLEAIHESV